MVDVKTKYVSVVIFNIVPQDIDALSSELALLMQRKGPLVPGLVESIVLTNETKTQLLSVSQWESRHAWSAAVWDEDLGRMLTDLVEGATSFETRAYEPVTIVRMQ